MRLRRRLVVLPLVVATAAASAAAAHPAGAKTCRQNAINETPNDSYLPGSPVRTVAGRGHVLRGVVRSALTCRTIAHAKLEFFQAGPDGNYSDGVTSWAGRATVFATANGGYRFESRYPTNYAGVRPHIHFRVSAPGFETMHRTYFVQAGKRNVMIEVRLEPAP
jgi:protocatechuate 3,4-dioxygenase beta subunit